MNKSIGIYIHIPFCISKCYYCDFVSFSNKDEDYIDTYIDAVCRQILQNVEVLSEYNINTIYFGGGTPSYIDSKYIVRVMDILKMFLSEDISNKEFTIEVNPNSITKEKLEDYRKAGINRISIGLQSTDDTILKKIGRKHKYEDFLNTLKLCKALGFNNISLDLIYPLPGLDINGFKNSLDKVMTLKDEYDIKHISIYNLEIHEGTKLDFLLKEGYETLCDEDEEMAMKRLLEKILNYNNYINYEISNFAIQGFGSKHNLNYWNQGEYLGFGVNASSFFAGTRYTNTSNIDEYIDNINLNKTVIDKKEDLDKLSLMKEYVILKLRLKNGVNISEFKSRFNVDIFSLFKINIDKLINLKLIELKEGNILLTAKGKDLANIVWQEFI